MHRSLRDALGRPALTVDGDGPVFEVFLTGTGFVASPDGLALTNRHVVRPWEFDAAARGLLESGFVAEWSRLVGFLADGSQAHDLQLRVISDDSDLAVVLLLGVEGRVPFLELASEPPSPGDPVIVMGYPLGLRVLMARSDADFIDRLRREGVTDFFEQASQIAAAGFMKPLATLGIVGQVTSAKVVYDAETTSGGSGGPVLSLDGRVVAVNTAILPEFGGSNLGVPVARVRALIERLRGG